MKRLDVALKMRETGVVPLYYHEDLNRCKEVISACYHGGMEVFEFTNRGCFAHEVFGALVKWARKEIPGLVLGVGSVVEAGTASLFMQLGANFIVSPLLNEDMARVCNRRKVLWIPGCASVSEVNRAEELGAEIVKLFPGSTLGGPSFLKAILGPCPWSSIMPSGGVDPSRENMEAWFSAGAFCLGMGSQLITKSITESGKFDQLKAKAARTIALVGEIRK